REPPQPVRTTAAARAARARLWRLFFDIFGLLEQLLRGHDSVVGRGFLELGILRPGHLHVFFGGRTVILQGIIRFRLVVLVLRLVGIVRVHTQEGIVGRNRLPQVRFAEPRAGAGFGRGPLRLVQV